MNKEKIKLGTFLSNDSNTSAYFSSLPVDKQMKVVEETKNINTNEEFDRYFREFEYRSERR